MSAKIYNFDDYKRARDLRAASILEAHRAFTAGSIRMYEQAHQAWHYHGLTGSDCGCPNGQSRWFQ